MRLEVCNTFYKDIYIPTIYCACLRLFLFFSFIRCLSILNVLNYYRKYVNHSFYFLTNFTACIIIGGTNVPLAQICFHIFYLFANASNNNGMWNWNKESKFRSFYLPSNFKIQCVELLPIVCAPIKCKLFDNSRNLHSKHMQTLYVIITLVEKYANRKLLAFK